MFSHRLKWLCATINIYIRFLFETLKWPIALVALVATPGAMVAVASLSYEILQEWRYHFFFCLGLGLYGLLYKVAVRHWRFSWFSTLEHELTHAMVAMMSFCKVTNIKVTWKRGGECHYQGHTNWVITLAPYFLPTITLVILFIGYWIPSDSHDVWEFLLGFSLCYHFLSTWRETHWQQSDLTKVGFSFSFLFLPFANLMMTGMIFHAIHPHPEAWNVLLLTPEWLMSLGVWL